MSVGVQIGLAGRHILVPLSLAELGETKLPVAVVQARAYGAGVLLLHVRPRGRKGHPEVDAPEAEARAYLELIAARLRSEGADAHILIRHGRVAQAILEEIRTRQIDLVVIGADARPGLARGLLGSVANEVIAKALCPVMLVKPDLGLSRRSRRVRSFAEDLRRTGSVSTHDLGLRTVDPGRIIGSVARPDELEAGFRIRRPGRSERERYARILEATKHGDALPPVILYKLGYGYYILEGHRRVAAAKELGLTEILAEVTDFVPAADALRRQVFMERREFEAATGLTRLAAAIPGHYLRLRETIEQFARQQGIEDLHDAAQLWESTVFWPAARTIRASGWAEHIPDLRTADIYLLLSESIDRLSQRDGRSVGWEEALTSLLAEGNAPLEPASPRRGVSEVIGDVLGR